MRVVVVGAGAVGGVAASSAVAGGHEVAVCVRTPFPELILVRDGAEHRVPATLVASPEEAGPADVVIVALKVQDTGNAAPWLARLCGPDTVTLSLQNGLEGAERLAPIVPAGTTVPSVIYVASERLGPGRILHHWANRILLPDGATTARLVAALGPELEVTVTPDFTTEVWRKLVGNVVVNPLTALTLRRVGVVAEPALAPVVSALVTEAVAVARAAGANLDDREVEALLATYDRWADETSGSSMYYDRVAGRPLEHEALTGAVVATGERLGVPTPTHATLLALLRVLDPAAEVALRAG